MIPRHIRYAGLSARLSCHSFRATGITTYLESDDGLELSQWIAGHVDS